MEDHTSNNSLLPRKARREDPLQEAVEIINTYDDPNRALKELVQTLERHDIEKIFEEFEDPYSNFNIGTEYTEKYWEAWKAVM